MKQKLGSGVWRMMIYVVVHVIADVQHHMRSKSKTVRKIYYYVGDPSWSIEIIDRFFFKFDFSFYCCLSSCCNIRLSYWTWLPLTCCLLWLSTILAESRLSANLLEHPLAPENDWLILLDADAAYFPPCEAVVTELIFETASTLVLLPALVL